MIYDAVGCVCSLTLGNGFSKLNGNYYVALEMPFKDAVSSKIDFMKFLYTPAGKSSADYEADYNSYLSDTVLVCNSITDNSVVYYIPTSLLLAPPDPSVKAYYRRFAIIDLGIADDANALLPAITQIGQIATAATGITNCVSMGSNKTNLTYMTDDAYQSYLATLSQYKTTLENPITTIQKLERENADLRARLAANEEQLIQFLTVKDTPNP